MSAGEIAQWLTENFTPDRYRDKYDNVAKACSMLYGISPWPKELVQEFISRLWGSHGELPDYIPAFDHYGRLVCHTPNLNKPDIRRRIQENINHE